MEKLAAKPVATKPQPFVILSESPVQRCEICHQSDCLNPETGVCSRCQGVDVMALEQRQTVDEAFQNILKEHQTEDPFSGLRTVATIARILGGVMIGIMMLMYLLLLVVKTKFGESLSAGLGLFMIFLLVFPMLLVRLAKRKKTDNELP
ncbi:MAG: hypothetical protein K1Y36_12185 [Blastocatellia bacterium]|nr:hypothetical protein [Blastocatellia bacterium]